MKNTQNVLNMLLSYISKSNKIDEKEKVTLLIKTFFSKEDNKEIPSLYKLNITKISVDESTNDTISISIELVEAGLLVGKEGKTIKQLGGFISKNLDKKARIYVKESNLFELESNV
jgi:ribosomal protein S3